MGEGGGFSWGGAEGWGEKAYNCNWITIKIKIKKMWTHKKNRTKCTNIQRYAQENQVNVHQQMNSWNPWNTIQILKQINETFIYWLKNMSKAGRVEVGEGGGTGWGGVAGRGENADNCNWIKIN